MRRSQRADKPSLSRPRLAPIVGGVVALAVLLLSAWYFLSSSASSVATHEHSEMAQAVEHRHDGAVELPHIHGMGYSMDGNRLVVAAHDGLRVYAGGEWLIPDVAVNDYMGYSATDTGFYSSGHPGPGSALPNPLGLVQSDDAGKTLTALGFARESDFHLMAAGYTSHALYILNAAPNSRLTPGLHHSLDNGQSWKQSALQGLPAQPLQLAVHPSEVNTIALATEGGLFLSTDYGNRLQQLGGESVVSAAAFDVTGKQLFFGYQTLSVYDVATGEIAAFGTPPITEQDGIAYIAVNPVRPEEMALATFQRNVYLSTDGGASWQAIAEAGKGL